MDIKQFLVTSSIALGLVAGGVQASQEHKPAPAPMPAAHEAKPIQPAGASAAEAVKAKTAQESAKKATHKKVGKKKHTADKQAG